MPDLEDIVQRIALSGQDDVIEAFAEIGKAGEEALAKLAEAAGTLGELFAGAVVAVTGLAGALGLWADQASKATVAMANLAEQSGTTIEELSGLEGALTSMGGSTEQLQAGFRRLALRIETEWAAIQKSTRDARDVQISDHLAMVSSTLSVARAQESLRDSQQKLIEAQGGPKLTPAVQAQQKIEAATLAVEEAQNRLAEAHHKAAEAAKKAAEDQKNSIESVGAAVKSVVAGMQTLQSASAGANLNIQNVIKGLLVAAQAAPGAEEGLQGFAGGISDIAGLEPSVMKVFNTLADFMHNSQDMALNTALAFRLFGRGVSIDLIQAMTKLGSEGLMRKNIEDFQRWGLVLGKEDKEAAEDFHHAWNELSHDLFTTATQIGNLFAPAFTAGMRNLISVIQQNHGAIIEWAQAIASRVKPIIEDFFNLLTGREIKTPWIKTIVDAFTNVIGPAIKYAGEVILSFFQVLNGQKPDLPWVKTLVDGLGQVKDAILAIWNELDRLTKKFNEVFGTQLSTVLVAAALVIGGRIGASLVAGIVAAIGLRAGLIAAAIAAAAALKYSPEDISKGLEAQRKAEEEKRKQPLSERLRDPFTHPEQFAEKPAETEGVVKLNKDASEAGDSLKSFADRAKGLFDDFDKASKQAAEATGNIIDMLPNVSGAPRPETELSPGTVRVPPVVGIQPPNQPGRQVPPAEGFVNIPYERRTAITTYHGPEIDRYGGEASRAPYRTTSMVPARGAQAEMEAAVGKLAEQLRAKPLEVKATEPLKVTDAGKSERLTGPGVAEPTKAEASFAERAKGLFDAIPAAVQPTVSVLQSFKDGLAAADAALKSFVEGINAALKQAATAGQTTAQPLATPKAHGGLVGGYGSGTSDSNLIRASKGEYVVTASGSNLGDAIRHFAGGFALGGLVDDFAGSVSSMSGSAASPQAARSTSGGNSALHPVTIVMPDGRQVSGLRAPPNVVAALRTESIINQVSRTGPSPSWHRG